MTAQIQNFMQHDLFDNPDNACDIKYIDTPIQGHLVTASFMHVSHATSMHTDYIKKQLVHMLAAGLIDKKLISFTKIDDPLTLTTSFYARGFLVSDDKVRLIRTLVK
jgi:hypothetical protein